MKKVFIIVFIVVLFNNAYGQNFTIDIKGIVKCPNAKVGEKGTIFGVTYEAVDYNLLVVRRNEGADLTKVCTSLVTTMQNLFYGSSFNQPIGNWDVSKVTTMYGIFAYSKFNQPIGNWDVSNVTNMNLMFYESPFNQPLENWNVRNVKYMYSMFEGSMMNQPIGNWNVNKVEDMSWMFAFTPFNQPIGNWNVSSVQDMSHMFRSSPFNQPIENWNVSKVSNMSYMFRYSAFNQPIGKWDVSNVTDMNNMFYYNSFNQPIENWNVSKVTNMEYMLAENRQFNQIINQWCVTNIKTEPTMFSINSPLSIQNKPVWGTCPGLPATTSLNSPTDNTVGTGFKPSFVWNSSINATKYQLQVFEGVEKMVLDTVLSSTSITSPKSLKSKTLHNWRVRGINESKRLNGEWSTIWKFTTPSIPIPNLTSPLNGQINIEYNPVQLVWSTTNNTVGYHLQVSPFETLNNLIVDNNSLNTSLYTLPNFISGNPVKFYWRVRSKIDSGEFGEWSPVWSFTRAKLTSDDNTTEQPFAFELKPNYPNPFNPTTTISFSIPTTSSVRLEVFSILGQPVTVLVDKMMTRGTHTVTFDAGSLSSGVYLYKLSSGDQSQIRMMNLVK
jgi:surface protein